MARSGHGSTLRRLLLGGSLAAVGLMGSLAVWLFAHSISGEIDPAFAEGRLLASTVSAAAANMPAAAAAFPAGVVRLDSLLEPLRARHKVPALAVAIVREGRLHAVGASGVRKAGSAERAQWSDRFHIGSDTKAMTATLAAMLIEEGKFDWDTTLPQLFPELVPRMRPEYRGVTIEMLMHHRSGFPDDRSDLLMFARNWMLTGTPREQRRRAMELAVSRPPVCRPGTKNVYANINFAILGAAIERVTGDSWESQLRTRLFEPLGMRSAGFGSPNAPDRVDAPWGHLVTGPWPRRMVWISKTKLPAAIWPAGNVSLSMSDWARFALLHLDASRGECRLLSCATFARLQEEQPPGSHFAAGWGVVRNDSGETVLTHAGSDGWWFATIAITPRRNEAILVATNIGMPRGEAVCREAGRAAQAFARRGDAPGLP